MKPRIYLDNNASTIIDPRVLSILIKDLEQSEGNPSSIHARGQEMKNRLAKARRTIAAFINARPAEVVFTSGGTEGMNMLIKGFLFEPPGHFITSNVEHACVECAARQLEQTGWRGSYLPAGLEGAVTAAQVAAALQPDTRFITLIAANNETGVLTDIEAIAALAHENKIPLLLDGVALLGKELFRIPEGVAAMAFSGHKIHAPKGIGFAFIRQRFKLAPLLCGGGQEGERRGGTENIHGIIALAEAMQILAEELPISVGRMRQLKEQLQSGLEARLTGVSVNGFGKKVSNTINLSFAGVEGESLLMSLDLAGLAVSHGSACSSGSLEPSRILRNMGVARKAANSSIRFSLSRMTTVEEIELAIEIVAGTVSRLRSIR